MSSSSSLAAVVFDWAGTLFDFGSQAPMGAFVELFARHGVEISIDEARVPMGLPKWDHIQALGTQPRIAAAWAVAHGRAFDVADVSALYEEFTPMNALSVRQHAQAIPGAAELLSTLRQRGLKVGSTTGYNRPIMEVVQPLLAAQGIAPDNLVCAGDVPLGRPSPMAMYQCFLDLEVGPAYRVVKVDDTLPGLSEGRQAGCWTVAITASGNEVGLSLEAWQRISIQEQQRLVAVAHDRLAAMQPDYTIDTVADLLPVLEDIELRLARGERPRPV